MHKKRVVIIIQARMGSTRLPGKSLKSIKGKPMLDLLTKRLQLVDNADEIVVATTTNPKDDPIADYCKSNEIKLFRGSEEDVLDRFYQTATKHQADVIVRITGDCPLMDPNLVRAMIHQFQENGNCDYLSNTQTRTFPRGLDVEVFNFKTLSVSHAEAIKPHEKEHVTPFIYHHPERFKIEQYINSVNLSDHRWTVDTPEDFELVEKIIGEMLQKPNFSMADVLTVLKKHPDWVKINAHIEQKKLPEHHNEEKL